MKSGTAVATLAAVSTLAFGMATAAAQDKPPLEVTYEDIKSVYGVTRRW